MEYIEHLIYSKLCKSGIDSVNAELITKDIIDILINNKKYILLSKSFTEC